MSLREDIIDAKRMVDELRERAREDGITPYEYVLKNGEPVEYSARNFFMLNMEFMTFYTTSKWKKGQVVMILGDYLVSEVNSLIEKEPSLIPPYEQPISIPEQRVIIYLRFKNMETKFGCSIVTDGWGSYEGAKYRIPVKGYSYLNWTEDPFVEVKE